MLHHLACRECGIDRPARLQLAERTRRYLDLHISRYEDIKSTHVASVNTLHIDAVEQRYLLSGGSDGVIGLFDLDSGTASTAKSGSLQQTINPLCTVSRSHPHRHHYSVETVQWYPLDTGLFLSSGMDGLLKVWDTNVLRPAETFKFDGGLLCHAMSHVTTQHVLVAIGTSEAKLRLVDMRSGSCSHTLKENRLSNILALAWSTRDEFMLASGSADCRVLLWDVRKAKSAIMTLDQHNNDTTATPESEYTAHNAPVNSLVFTPSGLRLLSFGRDKRLHSWDTLTGRNSLLNFGHLDNDCPKSLTMCTSLGTKPEFVFVPSDCDIVMMDLSTGDKVDALRGHYSQVHAVVRHPGEDTFGARLYSGSSDTSVLVWSSLRETETAYKLETTSTERRSHGTGQGSFDSPQRFVSRVGAGARYADQWSDEDT